MPGSGSLDCDEADRDVTLADRATFPSSTFSTHFSRGAVGVTTLRRLGVLDEVLSFGPPKLACEYIHMHGGETPVPGPPQEPGDAGFCLSVRREPLGDVLVRRANREGTVRVLRGTRLVDLKRSGERITGAVLARDDQTLEVRSRLVVAADGRHSPIAAALDPPLEFSDRPVRAMYCQYVTGFS